MNQEELKERIEAYRENKKTKKEKCKQKLTADGAFTGAGPTVREVLLGSQDAWAQ